MKAHLSMLVATVLVATSFPVGAAITHGLDSLVLTFLRFLLAATIFAPFVAWRYGILLPGLRDLGRYSLLSACLVAFFSGMFEALQRTSALNAATIFTLAPGIAALVSTVVLRERIKRTTMVALPIGVLGAVWVIFRGDLSALLALEFGSGDALFLAATCAMGLYSPLVKALHRGEPMAQMTFWTLTTGAAWLLLLSAPRLGEVDWTAIPGAVIGGIAYLAVFTTIITFFIMQWSTTVLGPVKVMSYTYLNPALVMMIGIAMRADGLSFAVVPGLIVITAATLVLQMGPDGRQTARPMRSSDDSPDHNPSAPVPLSKPNMAAAHPMRARGTIARLIEDSLDHNVNQAL
ncbi:MAG: EamA family transporter [Gemmatimonadetes bacterium]|nr:EamA family transporter [Gemmatimonadota bacterium]